MDEYIVGNLQTTYFLEQKCPRCQAMCLRDPRVMRTVCKNKECQEMNILAYGHYWIEDSEIFEGV